MPSKIFNHHRHQDDIEAIFTEISFWETKWFICRTYHPSGQEDHYTIIALNKENRLIYILQSMKSLFLLVISMQENQNLV